MFIGDIFGKSGLLAISNFFPIFLEKYQPNFVIGNAENAADGKGLTDEIAELLFSSGFDVLTTGNHIWDNWKSRPLLAKNNKILRPMNYPSGNPGFGYFVYPITQSNYNIGVINLQGRTFMHTIDCPFRSAERAINDIKTKTNIIVVDFHAEATAEKISLANFLDGKVSAFIGTHTHIQTSDERILPNGTAYITDVGMTGPYNSVVGLKTDIAIRRFVLQTPHKFEQAIGDEHIAGVYLEINPQDGKCLKIERFFYPEFVKHKQIVNEDERQS
ncbi:MAG: TIGR00282 family metallophosphoesterase [Ignavibacteria bacterium]|nr:TIGR00282 family metallophosphoesterase [Ignavibacteria bacterium]